jgi:hypothetical protein
VALHQLRSLADLVTVLVVALMIQPKSRHTQAWRHAAHSVNALVMMVLATFAASTLREVDALVTSRFTALLALATVSSAAQLRVPH